MGAAEDRFIGIFLILLVVSLPIVGTRAYAMSISDFYTEGKDKVEGFSAKDDKISFNAVVSSETPVSPSDLILYFTDYSVDGYTPQISFSDKTFCKGASGCSGSGPTYTCRCDSTFNPKNSDPFTIYLKTTDGSQSSTMHLRDSLAPKGTASLSISEGKLVLAYDIKDYSCTSQSCDSYCSGVKSITLSDNKGWTYTIPLESTPNSCSMKGEEAIAYPKEGEVTFKVTSVDMFGNEGEIKGQDDIRKMNIDVTSPEIVGFKILKDGEEVSMLSSEGRQYDIQITVKDKNLKSVSASLISLVENQPKASVCKQSADIHECIIKDVTIKVSESQKSVKAIIGAMDLMGNIAERTIEKDYPADTSRPNVIFLGTKGHDESSDKSFFNPETNGNNISMIVEETGSGLKDVYLDLSYVNGITTAESTRCVKGVSNLWECYWENITIKQSSSQVASVYVLGMNEDLAGNLFTGISSEQFYIDKVKPILNSIEFYSITEYGPIEFHKSSDNLLIVANLTDGESGVGKAFANFSMLYNIQSDKNTQKVAAECTKGKTTTLCIWETSAIRKGYSEPKIPFTFYDVAGNPLKKEERITIYEPVSGISDCFSLQIKKEHIIPIQVNTVLSFSNSNNYYFQTIPFSLISNCGDDAKANNLYLAGDCEAGSTYSFNPKTNSGFIQFPITAQSIRSQHETGSDAVSYPGSGTCAIVFNVVDDNKIAYDTPEVEDIIINIPLHDDIAMLGEPLLENLEDIHDEIGKNAETLHKLNNAVKVATKVCQIKNIFFSILTSLHLIMAITSDCLAPAVTEVATFGTCRAAMMSAVEGERGSQAVKDVLDNGILNAMCGFVLCDNVMMKKKTQTPEDLQKTGETATQSVQEGAKTEEVATAAETAQDSGAQEETKSKESVSACKGVGLIRFPGGFLPIVRCYAGLALSWIPQRDKGDPTPGRAEYGEKGSLTIPSSDFSDLTIPPSNIELAKSSETAAYLGLCVPALIYHWDLKKQNLCWKGLCYIDGVKAGIPVSECDKHYEYLKCMQGGVRLNTLLQVFGFDKIAEAALKLLKNPTLLAWTVTKATSRKICYNVEKAPGPSATGIYASACMIWYGMEVTDASITLSSSIKNVINSFKPENMQDYCETFETSYDELMQGYEGAD